jgi:hypothetical protein
MHLGATAAMMMLDELLSSYMHFALFKYEIEQGLTGGHLVSVSISPPPHTAASLRRRMQNYIGALIQKKLIFSPFYR